jgi:pimeloyl-ACP methyl ester carboxylesterase
VQRCFDKSSKEFLANVGTASVVKDLDQIRAALGDDKLTYLGFSYGTRIGSAYAEEFPQNVRARVLVGAIDPNADPIEEDLRQTAAFQKAFDDYAADCAKDPNCPLGTDPAKATDVYKSMVEPLVDEHAETQDRRGLGYSDALIGTILPLYSPSIWPRLTEGLNELKQDRGDMLLLLADLYMHRDPTTGKYDNATDVRVAVNCVDSPAITDQAKLVDKDRRSRELAPFMSYGEFTGLAPKDTCSFWQVPPTTEPHEISVKGLPPTLVISTTNDPATPYKAGVDLAEQLGGTLVTFDGTQHTVAFQGNPCIDNIVATYLIDVKVPAPDTRC